MSEDRAGDRPISMTARRAEPSDARGLAHLASHVALLCCTGGLVAIALGSGWALPAMLAHGIVLVSSFAPLHESVHGTAFRSRWLNEAVARVLGCVQLLPATHFRCFHLAHHRFTQDPARDPELGSPKPTSLLRLLRTASGVEHWRDRVAELARHAAGRVDAPWVPGPRRRAVVAEARAHLAFYAALAAAAIATGWSTPLFYWVLPALLGQPFLRLTLLAEHTACAHGADAFANTRTTRTHPLVRFLMWNMPYHAEHHARPDVPFHALPILHRELGDALRVTAPGYAAFHTRYWAELRRGSGNAKGSARPPRPRSFRD